MKEISLINILIYLVLIFVLLPGLFIILKRLRYHKLNSGRKDSLTQKGGMIYSAKKGKIEGDQSPKT